MKIYKTKRNQNIADLFAPVSRTRHGPVYTCNLAPDRGANSNCLVDPCDNEQTVLDYKEHSKLIMMTRSIIKTLSLKSLHTSHYGWKLSLIIKQVQISWMPIILKQAQIAWMPVIVKQAHIAWRDNFEPDNRQVDQIRVYSALQGAKV